jgi:hypothetical protein
MFSHNDDTKPALKPEIVLLKSAGLNWLFTNVVEDCETSGWNMIGSCWKTIDTDRTTCALRK